MTRKTTSVLFICFLNSIRSPMAEGLCQKLFGDNIYADSCGIQAGELDDLMVAVMREKGIDMSEHKAQTLDNLSDGSFDVVVAFTEDAGAAAEAVFAGSDTEILIWPTPDPTHGVLDVRAMMNNYRSVRDFIEGRLKKRFGE
ncbi:MAG: low molecular weight phosphatase family protein [Hellea sp.]|nr:low molecular weight phosphatase family protein [Hellea sp.]